MKKYKHITGATATLMENKINHIHQYCSPEFGYIHPSLVEKSAEWEEIKLDYEILSFKHEYGSIYKKTYSKDKSKYCQTIEGTEYTEDAMIKDKSFTIHSIKRLSDNETFTIGDDINLSRDFEKYKINSFLVDKDTIKVWVDDSCRFWYLENVIKTKKLLFTTEDGVDIYEGNETVSVDKNTFTIQGSILWSNTSMNHKKVLCLLFSTKIAAEEWVLMNKPCLSINDLIGIDKEWLDSTDLHIDYETLEELVVTKLKKT